MKRTNLLWLWLLLLAMLLVVIVALSIWELRRSPPRGEVQVGESISKDRKADVSIILRQPGREAPYPEFVLQWASKVTAAQAISLLADVLEIARRSHLREVDPCAAFLSGLEALRAAADSPGAAASFPALKEPQKQRAWCEAIAAAAAPFKEPKAPSDEAPDTLKSFAALLDANLSSVALPPGIVVYECIQGALASLDSGCRLLTPEEMHELSLSYTGRVAGIGIELTMRDGIPTAEAVYDGSPAWRAGVRPGDRVVGVDGRSTAEMNIYAVARLLRGKPGSTVSLEVARPLRTSPNSGRAERIFFRITRELIELPAVDGAEILDGSTGVAYLRLRRFQADTLDAFSKALQELSARGMRALALDLRDCSGGAIETVVGLAGMFLDGGAVAVRLEGRLQGMSGELRCKPPAIHANLPLAVLTDARTRSAGEILAGALQDHRRAMVFGSKTQGKGSVQKIFPLEPHNMAVRLTICRFYTPHGHSIEGCGITPDVPVSEKEEGCYSIGSIGSDPVVRAAVESLSRRFRTSPLK